ncbi:MAG: hypothetical protein ACPLRW_07880 [Moorellales bacterium]
MSAAGRQALRQELIEYFSSAEGQKALARAPKVTVEPGEGYPLQEQPVEKIVDLLLEELD